MAKLNGGLGEWVRWVLTMAAVATTLVGVNAADNSADRAADTARTVADISSDQRANIVETGRNAIRNGCEFDNQHTRELKSGLVLFLRDHRRLHAIVDRLQRDQARRAYKQRDVNRVIRLREVLAKRRGRLHAIERGIGSLTVRDCEVAALTLKAIK